MSLNVVRTFIITIIIISSYRFAAYGTFPYGFRYVFVADWDSSFNIRAAAASQLSIVATNSKQTRPRVLLVLRLPSR